MSVEIAKAGDHVPVLAKRADMISRRKDTSGEQLAILITGRDHVLLRSFVHRQHVLILVDDGIADDEHTIIGNAVDKITYFLKPAVFAQRVEVFADVRLENVEMTIDQLGRTEGHFIGKMNF